MRWRQLVTAFSVVCSVAAGACDKPEGATATTPSPSVSASASVAVPLPPPPPANTPVAWSGTYTSAPGSLYVYDGGEWKGVHFRGDDAAVALGDGPVSLTIDPKTKEVHGVASGPLGDVVLRGTVTDGELTFTVFRKNATDHGLTGTGVGRVTDASLTGAMRLSQGDAHVIREAKFTLTKTKI